MREDSRILLFQEKVMGKKPGCVKVNKDGSLLLHLSNKAIRADILVPLCSTYHEDLRKHSTPYSKIRSDLMPGVKSQMYSFKVYLICTQISEILRSQNFPEPKLLLGHEFYLETLLTH